VDVDDIRLSVVKGGEGDYNITMRHKARLGHVQRGDQEEREFISPDVQVVRFERLELSRPH
jgi:hypothetical protein